MKTRHQDKAPSMEPPEQVQTQPQKRSRKRRASTSSETSVQPASQDPSSQNKRRKKSKASSQGADDLEHPQLDPLEEETLTQQTHLESKHVRFEPGAAQNGTKSIATDITPHTRKQIDQNRRITLSPADLRNGTNTFLKTKSRPSLPLNLTPGERSDAQGPQIHLTRLTDLINDRKQQRLEQKRDLVQIDGSDEIDIEDEEDMLVYTGHDNAVSYPKLNTTSSRRISEVFTEERTVTRTERQSAPIEDKAEREREAFEDAIKRLTREASDAKAALEILTIEVQSLGFGGKDTNTQVVMTSIRDSFVNIRERLEAALPGQVPANISNSDLVEVVIDRISLLVDQVDSQEQLINNNDQIRQELVNEINGLVDRLADAEIRKGKLEAANSEFDVQGQEDEKYIHEMETKLREIEKQHGVVAAVLGQKELQLVGLEKDNADLERTIEKLGQALQKYRTAEEKLHTMITRMEQDHTAALVKADDERKEQVEDLETRLNDETTKRTTAEADADDKQTVITDLEVRFEQVFTSLEDYKKQLAGLQQSEAAERTAKEAVQNERDEKTTFISELEIKIEQVEVELEDLQGQFAQLRDLSESEKRQREAAETELDESNAKITDLDARLHKHGVEANELRQKLFEVQMREKEGIKKLEELASEREEQFQEDMASEIARREEAESLAAERGAAIADLEDQLAALEERMTQALVDKEQKIDELSDLVSKLREENDVAKTDLENAALDYQDLETTTATNIAQLGITIQALQTAVSTHTERITELENEAESTAERHASVIDQRDAQIANLNHEIYEAHQQIEGLEKDKRSLERRVESEAEAMLELQSNKDDEIAHLKSAIRAKQTEVEDLGSKATNVDQAWNSVMREKDAEITELSETMTERSTIITKLQTQNADLKELFKSYVREATATTDAMAAEIEAVRDAAADRDRALKDHGRSALEKMERMDTVGEMTTTVVEHAAVRKFKKSKKNARPYDSGIGVADSSPVA